MWRYFDFPEACNTLKIEVEPGSPAALATPEVIAAYFKQALPVREIGQGEYTRMDRVYDDTARRKRA